MSDEIRLNQLFELAINDIRAGSKAARIPPGSTLTVDLEVQLHDVRYEKESKGLFSRKKSESTRTISLRVATRLQIESPEDA